MTGGYIGLGSNLGDRGAHLRAGLHGLEAAGVRIVRVSSVWETEPVGLGAAGWFWNVVAAYATDRDPASVLERALAVERSRGRERRADVADSRTLDIDLLTYGDEVIDTPTLVVPHPGMWRRRFVLAPLAEVAGEWHEPRERLALLDAPARCRRLGPLATFVGAPV